MTTIELDFILHIFIFLGLNHIFHKIDNFHSNHIRGGKQWSIKKINN